MTESSAEDYLEELYKELAAMLGEAVWAFSRIEWRSYEFIGQLSNERLDQLMGRIGFSARISILEQLLDRSEADTELKEEATSALQEALKLAGRRNLLIHNPWRVYVDFDSHEFQGEFQKYTDDQKNLSREELGKFIKDCRASQARLEAAFGAL